MQKMDFSNFFRRVHTRFTNTYFAMHQHVATEIDENFTPGVESPVDSKYDVRIEVWDPQPRQP